MSGHTWTRARAGDRCGSCQTRLLALAPVCRLHTGRLRCAACAKQMFGEDAPDALAQDAAPVAPTPKSNARPLQPFVERMRATLGLDVKARAAGDTP